MKRSFQHVLNGLSLNRWSVAGVTLTTSSAITFVIYEAAHLAGLFHNAYIGLLTYLALPALFVAGLCLIPFSWWLESRRTGYTLRMLFSRQFDERTRQARSLGSFLVRTVGVLSLANVVFLLLLGSRAMHYMDTAEFCGTACHTVMGPEWAAYRESPHARVVCVDCHIGEGIGALIDAKLNGAWQMISLAGGLYSKPIPTPVHNLRPAAYTCEKCHWPEIFHENRIVNKVSYGFDSLSTPSYSTLLMKVGSGRQGLETGSHWHVSPVNEVTFTSVDDKAERIVWVDVKREDGKLHRYLNRRLLQENPEWAEAMEAGRDHGQGHIEGPEGDLEIHRMDCVDCHNRVGHAFDDPAEAIDEALRLREISRDLPYIKTRALGALTSNYNDEAAAMQSIRRHLVNYYERFHPGLHEERREEIDQAVSVLQGLYRSNMHPGMGIGWNPYPDNMGHKGESGCFRCHNSDMRDEKGRNISFECTLCHSILANDEDEPYKYIFNRDEQTPRSRREMQRYLREEFWRSTHSP